MASRTGLLLAALCLTTGCAQLLGLDDVPRHDDAGEVDAGIVDAGARDAGEPDAGARDAGQVDAGCKPAAEVCAAAGRNCGAFSDDGCGHRAVDCGKCLGAQKCGAINPGVCACDPNGYTATDWSNWPALPIPIPDTNYVAKDGVVTDLWTCLQWEQDNDGSTYAGDQLAHCATVKLGGKTWRTPTAVELGTLVDFGLATPLNSTFTLAKGSFIFWSSDKGVDTTEPSIWAVDFENGASTEEMVVTTNHGVRCVWSGQGMLALPSWTVQTDVAIDNTTHLTWEKSNSDTIRTWAEAGDYCSKFNGGGLASGWRLPTIHELQTLVDYSRTGPAIVSSLKVNANVVDSVDEFWTSTSAGANESWIMGSYTGESKVVYSSKSFLVRCVHSM